MLEQAGLLLGAWRQVSPRWQRQPVWDLASRQLMGFVQQALSHPWLHWLRPELFEVFETEDAALLCRIVRLGSLLWCWEVQDADQQRVAFVARRRLFDARGRLMAQVCLPTPCCAGVFRMTTGQTLATCEYIPGGIGLRFVEASPARPLLRMALLGAIIVYAPKLSTSQASTG